jgi:hypothetical protein
MWLIDHCGEVEGKIAGLARRNSWGISGRCLKNNVHDNQIEAEILDKDMYASAAAVIQSLATSRDSCLMRVS